MIRLPNWARDLGVAKHGAILVDGSSLSDDWLDHAPENQWQHCDWFCAAWHHLTGSVERKHEANNGPAGSYAFRLNDAPPELYDFAWANRIFLFLRRWSAWQREQSETELFGQLPQAEIVLTHDVDALKKTPEIRIKQSAFHAYNAGRALIRGNLVQVGQRAKSAMIFLLQPASFDTFSAIRRMEADAGLRSVLHFYGDPAGYRRASISRILIDPAYDVLGLKKEFAAFKDGGWTIGLHQSTCAWCDASVMRAERLRVEETLGDSVEHCRQHWLRFSWNSTWRAQQEAGLSRDSTLGFNDRPGFRNGAALRINPWDFNNDCPMKIEAEPMVFMDSHFYDYGAFDSEARLVEMARWLDEIKFVHGQATVNWHTHTITTAYGWEGGYRQLISLLTRN